MGAALTHKELIQGAKAGDRFLIVGFGVTGKAIATFFDDKGFKYYVDEKNKVLDWNGKGFLGRLESEEDLLKENIKVVFPSPGVALTHPIIRRAHEKNIPIIGELELASFYLEGEFIAVTGTNGKSTAVKLINTLLKDAKIENGLKGNIGSPLISAVNEPPQPYYVIEESSYQLELVGMIHHKIAICLNVSEDHFDRYESIEDYGSAKANIFKNSTKEDWFIYNHDDPICLKMSWDSKAKNIPFSLVNQFDEGGFVDGETMVIRFNGAEHRFALKECSLKGMHNAENMLASLIAALLINSDEEAVKSYKNTLKTFVALPHRLQKIHSHAGVDYYDDSKATNVGAVVMALASFDDSIILIAGGKDKHCDYMPLKGLLKGKVKKMILLGEAKDSMAEVLKKATEIELVDTMKEAVQTACRQAKSGDIVLLSPACSSFDQYENYEERGLDFQRWVKEFCK